MGPFTNVFHSDGTFGLEQTVGNMRFDLTKPGQGPSIIAGQVGNTSTVVKPNGQVSQEWQIGNQRFSSGEDGSSTLF